MRACLFATAVVLGFAGGHAVGEGSSEPKEESLARALILTNYTWAAVAEREQILDFLQKGETPKRLAELREKAIAVTRESMTSVEYARHAVKVLAPEFSEAEAEKLVMKLEDPLVRRWYEVVSANSKRLGETLKDWRKQVLAEYDRALRSQ